MEALMWDYICAQEVEEGNRAKNSKQQNEVGGMYEVSSYQSVMILYPINVEI